jgi:hypothetical protein
MDYYSQHALSGKRNLKTDFTEDQRLSSTYLVYL